MTPLWQYSQSSSTEDPNLVAKYRVCKGHPLKGQIAVVTDMLCGQGTPSGLKLVVQLICFNPSSLYKKVTLDYDDIVEQRSSSNTFAVCLW